jgi:hypothetical protein
VELPTRITSCCNLPAPVRHLSSNGRSAGMSFSQMQRLFNVEHCVASRSYVICQNEFRDIVPNKRTISRLANLFSDTGTVDRAASDMRKRLLTKAVDISNILCNIAFCFLILMVFFDSWNMCQESVAWLFDHPVL